MFDNTTFLTILQKLYDVAKRNCNEALHLAKKTTNDEAYEQSQKCLEVIKQTSAGKQSLK